MIKLAFVAAGSSMLVRPHQPDGPPPTIVVGRQEWMAENLQVRRFRNGDPIELVTDGSAWIEADRPAMCCYDNDEGLSELFGCLYNAHAVTDPRRLAPEGWRIPTDADWQELVDGLGGREYAGSNLKKSCDRLWKKENYNARDGVHFGGLAGGMRNRYGGFDFLRSFGYYWSSTPMNASHLWSRRLSYADPGVQRLGAVLQSAMSVRCVRDLGA